MMSDRNVWVKAGSIFVEHSAFTDDFIAELGDMLGDRVAVKDWRRITGAVGIVTEVKP